MSKSQNVLEVEAANERYAAKFGGKLANLPIPPARKFAILTCMDARIHASKLFGLEEGDAHVIRNAGGRASDDAIRSLVISHKLLGTNEFFVVHHTNCGMVTFTNEVMAGLLASSLDTAVKDENGCWRDVGQGPGSPEGARIDWLTISDEFQAVIDDVKTIRNHPLVPKTIPIYGYIYDVRTGKLNEVPEAMEAGAVAC
ncbi:MAG: carbonic anhydrase [Chthoniobacterales bacterium]|nr:carbonic anhydrase [Chthoniobacterales bacterium]